MNEARQEDGWVMVESTPPQVDATRVADSAGDPLLFLKRKTDDEVRAGQMGAPLHRWLPELDNDLPLIAEQYRELRRRYSEPGASARGSE